MRLRSVCTRISVIFHANVVLFKLVLLDLNLGFNAKFCLPAFRFQAQGYGQGSLAPLTLHQCLKKQKRRILVASWFSCGATEDKS